MYKKSAASQPKHNWLSMNSFNWKRDQKKMIRIEMNKYFRNWNTEW